MRLDAAKLIYFSPTRTTRRVLEGMALGLQVGQVAHVDLTPSGSQAQAFDERRGELAILGAPVYGGRIPVDAARHLRRLKGGNGPAVVVVVYGNRAYEDALLELNDLAQEAGFVPVAACAFVGEHSFSTDAAPLARARPDARDLEKAAGYGRIIWAKLTAIPSLDEASPLRMPGNHPYKPGGERLGIPPSTENALCTLCAQCVAVCPNAAIVVEGAVLTDASRCISCCACVKVCPAHARIMRNARIAQIMERLSRTCAERKEPELYL